MKRSKPTLEFAGGGPKDGDKEEPWNTPGWAQGDGGLRFYRKSVDEGRSHLYNQSRSSGKMEYVGLISVE